MSPHSELTDESTGLSESKINCCGMGPHKLAQQNDASNADDAAEQDKDVSKGNVEGVAKGERGEG